MTLRNEYKQKTPMLRDAEERAVPIYVLKSNTIPQMQSSLTSIFSLEIDPREAAMRETEDAIEIGAVVVRGRRAVAAERLHPAPPAPDGRAGQPRLALARPGAVSSGPALPGRGAQRLALTRAARASSSWGIRRSSSSSTGSGPDRPGHPRPDRAAATGRASAVARPAARHRHGPHLASALGPPRRAVAARRSGWTCRSSCRPGAGRGCRRPGSATCGRWQSARSRWSAASRSGPCRPSTRLPAAGRADRGAARLHGPRQPIGLFRRRYRHVRWHGPTLGEAIDVALLPVWGWGPTLGRGRHLDPEGGPCAAPDPSACRGAHPLGHILAARDGPGPAGTPRDPPAAFAEFAPSWRRMSGPPDRGRRHGRFGGVTLETRPLELRGGLRRVAQGLIAYGIVGLVVAAIGLVALIWVNGKVGAVRTEAETTVGNLATTMDRTARHSTTRRPRPQSFRDDGRRIGAGRHLRGRHDHAGPDQLRIARERQLRAVNILGAHRCRAAADAVGRIGTSIEGLDTRLTAIATASGQSRRAGQQRDLARPARRQHRPRWRTARLGRHRGLAGDVQAHPGHPATSSPRGRWCRRSGPSSSGGLWLRRELEADADDGRPAAPSDWPCRRRA